MRTAIKISPTMLESWRLAKDGVYENSMQQLIEKLQKKFEPNEAISRGTAFHELIENGTNKYLKQIERIVGSGKNKQRESVTVARVYEKSMSLWWEFGEQPVSVVDEYRKSHPLLSHETWENITIPVGRYEVTILMKIDGLEGLSIREAKTTGRAKNYNDYLNSMQWKVYLYALDDAIEVVYDVFVLNEKNDKCAYSEFVYKRPDNIKEVVMNELRSFISWLEVSENIELVKSETWDKWNQKSEAI